MRQIVTLTIGTYMISLFYLLQQSEALGASNFQILFNDIEIGSAPPIDYRFWTYFSFTFNVSADTTADFKLKINYINSIQRRLSVCNLKLRKIG